MKLTLSQQFENIYIEKNSLTSDTAQRAFQIFPKNHIHIIEDKSELKPCHTMNAEQFNNSKRQLLLASFKGKIF